MADDPELERPAGDEDEGGPVKTFLDHLEDLRWVLIKSAVSVAVAMLVCLIAGDKVVLLLRRPLEHATIHYSGTNKVVSVFYGTNKLGVFTLQEAEYPVASLGTNRFVAVRIDPVIIGTNQVLGWKLDDSVSAVEAATKMNISLKNFSPAGGFWVAFQVAMYGGIVLAAPLVLYYIASFVFPALRMKERKYVYRGMFYGLGLFLTGVAFCYFILMPFALAASQRYSEWLGFSADQWRAEDYISFVSMFMLGMGLGFEMPVIILTLVKIGVLNYKILSKARRYMIVINLVLGAVLTTPEVLTQVLMAVPLQGLYEITIWIAWYWEQEDRAKARRKAAVVLGMIALLAALVWAGWRYVWPLLHA
jgi:sec-independent protein translocase protein TatC